jgi:hypothetical protein
VGFDVESNRISGSEQFRNAFRPLYDLALIGLGHSKLGGSKRDLIFALAHMAGLPTAQLLRLSGSVFVI